MRQRETSIESCPPAIEPTTDPRPDLASREDAETLWRLVGRLDTKSREVLLLYYGEGMKVNEIAQLENLRESAVKMRLTRARALLGERVGALKGAIALASASGLSSGVMEAVKASGSLKLVSVGTAVIWGPLLASAFLGWFLGRDLERLRNHVPDATLRKARIGLWCGVLFFPAYLGVLALARKGGLSPYWAMAPFLLLPLYVCYIWLMNLLAFGTPGTKVKGLSFLAFAILAIVVIKITPVQEIKSLALGLLFVFQGLMTDRHKGNAGFASVHGDWLWGALKSTPQTESIRRDVSERAIRRWLSLLFQWGIVTAPLRTNDEDVSVCLRVRNPWRAWVPWLSHSWLRVSYTGEVTCEVAPADYVALYTGEEGFPIPGRRELQDRLGEMFTASLHASTESETDSFESLGLRRTEEAARTPNLLFIMKYVLPAMGLFLALISLYELFLEN